MRATSTTRARTSRKSGHSEQGNLQATGGATGHSDSRGANGVLADRQRPTRGLLRTHLRGREKLLVGAMGVGLLSAAFGLTQPLLVQVVIEAVQDQRPLVPYVLVLVGLASATAVTAGIQILVLGKLGAEVVRDTRKKLVARMLTLPMRTHQRHAPGELSSRLTSDPALIQSAVSEGLVTAASSALMLVGATAALLYLDAATFAFAFLATLASLLVALAAGKFVKHLRLSMQASIGNIGAEIQRAATAMPMLRAYNATVLPGKQLNTHIENVYILSVKLARLFAIIQPISTTLTQVSLGCAILVGGMRVASGEIELSTLIAFLMYFSMIVQPLGALSGTIYTFQEAAAGHERINAIDEMGSEDSDDFVDTVSSQKVQALKVMGAAPSIEFDRVAFAYRSESQIITDVSFTARKCSRTAIVGPTGAGKSTLFALLERFYDVGSGQITIDGIDIRAIPRSQLRSLIGYVDQSSVGVSGTLRENLCPAGSTPADEEIVAILESLGLQSLLARLDGSLDGEIGEAAVELSGGERQRVAIARAVLSNPLILLLDEPTASLDGQAEVGLANFLATHSVGSTVLTIAHRLSTVMNSDHIVVIDDGAAIASGTHDELMSSCALYESLVRTQLVG